MNKYFTYTAPYKWFYSIKCFYENIDYFVRTIIWYFQRASKGYADCDVWGFSDYLSQIICNGLRQLKEYSHGYPCDLNSSEEWDDILQTIIDGFEANYRLTNLEYLDNYIIGYKDNHMPIFDFDKSKVEEKELKEKFDKGMKLFCEYYNGLWD
jgi:hypothetical protein